MGKKICFVEFLIIVMLGLPAGVLQGPDQVNSPTL